MGYLSTHSDNGKETDPAYGVIWLGNAALQEAHHKLKPTANAIALALINHKYGLRFTAEHLDEAHQHLRPDEQFSGRRSSVVPGSLG